jgi:hypothetical protein
MQRTTPDDLEFHERLSINFVAGFDSIFGDGNVVSIVSGSAGPVRDTRAREA